MKYKDRAIKHSDQALYSHLNDMNTGTTTPILTNSYATEYRE